jgi:hypothetical protein
MLYTRFCYTTGDAAGQNMTGNATFAACEWIRANHPQQPRYILSGAIDTDKKHSAMNLIQTRGKRVIAEFVLKREVAKEILRVDTETLYRYRQIAAVGALQAGSAYSGAHSANGIAALFIATGQDEANVAESHAGITYGQLLDNGDYYWSVTLPALICATYGGGTGLPHRRRVPREPAGPQPQGVPVRRAGRRNRRPPGDQAVHQRRGRDLRPGGAQPRAGHRPCRPTPASGSTASCTSPAAREDLVLQNKMQRRLGQLTGTCFQRCVGMDALNSLHSVTFEIDEAHGTAYHQRFLASSPTCSSGATSSAAP